jgi:hypothetical protein
MQFAPHTSASDPESKVNQAEIDAAFAKLDRNHEQRMNPLTAWFEDYPFVSYWTEFMGIQCGRDGIRANLYEEYQRNHLWFAVIRPRVLKRDRDKCWVCRGRATEVHHASYHPFVMVGLADEWLYSVCRRCHEFVHKGHSDRPGTSNHDLWRRLNEGRVRRQVKLRRQYGETRPNRQQIRAWHALGKAQSEYAQLMRGVDWTFNQIDMGAMTWKPLEANLSSPAFLHLVQLRQAIEPR